MCNYSVANVHSCGLEFQKFHITQCPKFVPLSKYYEDDLVKDHEIDGVCSTDKKKITKFVHKVNWLC
jgi:hypothetical protein